MRTTQIPIFAVLGTNFRELVLEDYCMDFRNFCSFEKLRFSLLISYWWMEHPAPWTIPTFEMDYETIFGTDLQVCAHEIISNWSRKWAFWYFFSRSEFWFEWISPNSLRERAPQTLAKSIKNHWFRCIFVQFCVCLSQYASKYGNPWNIEAPSKNVCRQIATESPRKGFHGL